MVSHKDLQGNETETTRKPAEKDGTVTFKLKKKHVVIGGGLIAAASIFGVSELLRPPEERVREAIEEIKNREQQTPEATFPLVTTTTRVVISGENAPPATNIERPDINVPSTIPELSSEQQLLQELAPRFSEIINANPYPYDIALKVADFPTPDQNAQALVEADMNAMSLLLTHSLGRVEYINALFKNTPDDPYPNSDSLFEDALNIGRYRFPPENDPDYSEDNPNFGVLYRAIFPENEDLSDFYVENGNSIIVQTFTIERTHFNYDEEQQGWFIASGPDTSRNSVKRTYTRQVIPLENKDGEVVMTEVWQIDSLK